MADRKFVVAALFGVGLTGASYALAFGMGWVREVNWLEAFATFTSYACTYLCVKQSRWNYPIGAISTAALCVLFWQLGLYSSMALNAYLPIALVYGWFRWGRDDDTRPVTFVRGIDWIGYAAITSVTYGGLVVISSAFGAALPFADASILVLSILAQWLLDNKKVETWLVWIAVNVIAIGTYFNAGAYIVALQFVFFLGNAVYGWWGWRRTMGVSHA